jgi:hypothetical protein
MLFFLPSKSVDLVFLITSEPLTRLSYLVYYSGFIVERGVVTDPNRLARDADIYARLAEFGYRSCLSQLNPITFRVTICGQLKKSETNALIGEIRDAWQRTLFGLNDPRQIGVFIQGQVEFITEDR